VDPYALACIADRLGAADAVIPAPGGRPQPLVAAYGSDAQRGFRRAARAGIDSVTRAALELDHVRLEDAELAALPGGLAGFFNVNTPAELREAADRLHAAASKQGDGSRPAEAERP
jgi:molybdopterin-guanine dinucleotide biosynthesis protein A